MVIPIIPLRRLAFALVLLLSDIITASTAVGGEQYNMFGTTTLS
jgi:hypothetical protein